MDHPTVKEEKWGVEDIANIKVENENPYEPVFDMKSDIEIKQEPLYTNWTETCNNLYDSSFVCKEELHDKSLESVIVSDTVNTLRPKTDLLYEQQCSVSPTNKELSECVNVNPKSSNFHLGYSAKPIKLDPSIKYQRMSEDCTQTLGSSTEISTTADNIQRNISSPELEDSKTDVIPLALKQIYVDEINTNINDTDDNFEEKQDLKSQLFSYETQTPSGLKRKGYYRDSNYENTESFSEKVNSSTTIKIESVTDDNDPVKKETEVTCSDVITDDIRPVAINNRDKLDSSVNKALISYKTSCGTKVEYEVEYKSDLEELDKQKTARPSFSCDICNRKFSQNSSLKRHMVTHAVKKPLVGKPFSCKFCNYKCNRSQYLVCHLRTHTGEKPFSCNDCDYKCNQRSTLVKHIKTHTGEKPFSCNICDYKCNQKTILVNHIKTHTGEKPFSCNNCNYKCSRKNSLVNHIRIHTGEKPFSCTLCDYKCIRKQYLVGHMRTHTGEKLFSCENCNYKCNRKEHLTRHMRTHTGEKPFSCNICNFKFGFKHNLVNHMMTHTGEKPFSCNICNHKCKTKDHLTLHIRTHTGEKPYPCNVCSYRSSLKHSLISHMRTHTGEKPYSCDLCSYRCGYKDSLINHISTHTGEKPFRCTICNFKYASKKRLVGHMRTHTVQLQM